MVAISRMSPERLQQLVEEYPWFTAARREYIVQRTEGAPTKEAVCEAVRNCGIFLLSRSEFINLVSAVRLTPEELYQPEETPVAEVKEDAAPAEEKPKVQYYVVGGDYFGKEDFEELDRQGLSVSMPSFNPLSCALGKVDMAEEAPASRPHPKFDDKIYTETLAEIYFNQQIYKRALEIYEKLILLYPEKSAYFASLIEKVKNINK